MTREEATRRNTMQNDKILKILVSQGVIPYIKILIEKFEKGEAERDGTIVAIANAINEYDLYCQTGRGHK